MQYWKNPIANCAIFTTSIFGTEATVAPTGALLTDVGGYNGAGFQITVGVPSAHSVDAGDRTRVIVQRSLDDGTTWDDIGSSRMFFEVSIGAGSEVISYINVANSIEPGTSDDVYDQEDGVIAAETTKDVMWGNRVRVKVATVEGAVASGASGGFSIGVIAAFN